VKLRLLTGPHKNRSFCFEAPMCCTVGRAEDCAVRLSGNEKDCMVSRHHCRLEISPVCVRIQDLGSLNGTFRNGKKLAPEEAALTGAMAQLCRKQSVAESVEDGDIITVGTTSIQVNMIEGGPGGVRSPRGDSVGEDGAVTTRAC
jgi:eukaryotic-like serine/threonine-protein kinase